MTDHDETDKIVATPDLDEDNVEGHRMASLVDGGPEDFGQMRATRTRIDGDDDDVEGHFGHLKSPSSRGE
jgi:hypothetical protein